MDHEIYAIISDPDPRGRAAIEKQVATSDAAEISRLLAVCREPGMLAVSAEARQAVVTLCAVLQEFGHGVE